jgi:hypothetical protein
MLSRSYDRRTLTLLQDEPDNASFWAPGDVDGQQPVTQGQNFAKANSRSWGLGGELSNPASLALVDTIFSPSHSQPTAQSALPVNVPPSGQLPQYNALIQADDFAMDVDSTSVLRGSTAVGTSVSEEDDLASSMDALKFAAGTHPDIITMCTSIWAKSTSTLEEARIQTLLKLLRDFENERASQYPDNPRDTLYNVRGPLIRHRFILTSNSRSKHVSRLRQPWSRCWLAHRPRDTSTNGPKLGAPSRNIGHYGGHC